LQAEEFSSRGYNRLGIERRQQKGSPILDQEGRLISNQGLPEIDPLTADHVLLPGGRYYLYPMQLDGKNGVVKPLVQAGGAPNGLAGAMLVYRSSTTPGGGWRELERFPLAGAGNSVDDYLRTSSAAKRWELNALYEMSPHADGVRLTGDQSLRAGKIYAALPVNIDDLKSLRKTKGKLMRVKEDSQCISFSVSVTVYGHESGKSYWESIGTAFLPNIVQIIDLVAHFGIRLDATARVTTDGVAEVVEFRSSLVEANSRSYYLHRQGTAFTNSNSATNKTTFQGK
jgi:hypothetical protein